MLPNFVGIGTPRSGSTWLHELLKSHPEVFVPRDIKEVSFFNIYYEKGIDWYLSFFKDAENQPLIKAVGEITPTYLFFSSTAERVYQLGSVNHLLLILRNPVDQLYSSYWFYRQAHDYTEPFEEWLIHGPVPVDVPPPIETGHYIRFIENYLRFFDKDQISIFIYERAVQDLLATKQRLATCLGIDFSKFPEESGFRVINSNFIPKNLWLQRRARQIFHWLRKRELHGFIKVARMLPVHRYVKAGSATIPPMNESTKQRLLNVFLPTIEELEREFGLDLTLWK